MGEAGACGDAGAGAGIDGAACWVVGLIAGVVCAAGRAGSGMLAGWMSSGCSGDTVVGWRRLEVGCVEWSGARMVRRKDDCGHSVDWKQSRMTMQ